MGRPLDDQQGFPGAIQSLVCRTISCCSYRRRTGPGTPYWHSGRKGPSPAQGRATVSSTGNHLPAVAVLVVVGAVVVAVAGDDERGGGAAAGAERLPSEIGPSCAGSSEALSSRVTVATWVEVLRRTARRDTDRGRSGCRVRRCGRLSCRRRHRTPVLKHGMNLGRQSSLEGEGEGKRKGSACPVAQGDFDMPAWRRMALR